MWNQEQNFEIARQRHREELERAAPLWELERSRPTKDGRVAGPFRVLAWLKHSTARLLARLAQHHPLGARGLIHEDGDPVPGPDPFGPAKPL